MLKHFALAAFLAATLASSCNQVGGPENAFASASWVPPSGAPIPHAVPAHATATSSIFTNGQAVPAPIGAGYLSPPKAQGFASRPDVGDLMSYPNFRVVRRDGAYTWHLAELSEDHALAAIGSKLYIQTPAGERLSFDYQRHIEHPSGDWTWVGHLPSGEEALITFGAKSVFGTLGQPDDQMPLKLTTKGGQSWVIESDPKKLSKIINSATRPKSPDFFVSPDLAPRAPVADRVPVAANAQSASAVSGQSGTQVDVLLGYTRGFAVGLGGQSQANTRLNFLVDVTNQAYVNSQVDAQIRLVGTVEVDYPDATSNGTALEELTGYRAPSTRFTPPAAFAALRAARDDLGADMVSLVRKYNEPENGNCGFAWINGGGQTPYDKSDEFFAYSVVSDGSDVGSDNGTYFCYEETLAHELGHNMGSAHDRDTAAGEDKILQPNEFGAYAYSFGYKISGSASSTIMAYGDSGQVKKRVFSNPRITFCGGFPCGTLNDDNAGSLNLTIPVAATFRAAKAGPEPPSDSGRRVRSDANADGKSDILVQSFSQGLFTYWVMNSNVPLDYSLNTRVPAGYVQAARGDFNGDRRLDIIWMRQSDSNILMWIGGVGGFQEVAVRAAAPGWVVTGAGDIDGDGKDDLLMANEALGAIAYWIMRENSPVRYSPVFSRPSGYVQSANGDFNGDGKVDIVWTRPSDRSVIMWRGDGNGFAQLDVRDYSPGWQVDDAGDVDGDGKSDLIVSNPGQGLFAYWIMNGNVPLRYSPAFTYASGYARVATGDYNSDGKLDVLWSRASDGNVLMWLGDGNGFVQALVRSTPSGYEIARDIAAGGSLSSTLPPPPPSSGRRALGDVDADGKSDFILENGGLGLFAYWIMSGPSAVRFSPAFANPGGFVRAATGDFNGDGKLDIVWTRGAERNLVMSIGDGNGFKEVLVRPTSAGWAVTRAGDINGDGKSDFVLQNAGAGLVAFWIMDGSDAMSYSAAFTQPAGFNLTTQGDFNGDGKLDLVWTRSADRSVLLWQGNGIGFDAFLVGSFVLGWQVDGAGDANGDGSSDLLVSNASTGQFSYLVMKGPAIVSSATFTQPAGYSRASTGDYNGDGKLDLVWVRPVDRSVVMWIGDGASFAQLPVGNPSVGWAIFHP